MRTVTIAIGLLIAIAGATVALNTPSCSNPVARLKFDFGKPGLVCVVHAFDQDIVIER